VYHNDKQGNLTGWTRNVGQNVTDFTETGLMMLEKNDAKRPRKVQTVRYVATPAESHGQPSTLEVVAGDEVITYSYDTGKRVETSRTRVNGKQ
jgi:co-chaperonin GroES (HSP10)